MRIDQFSTPPIVVADAAIYQVLDIGSRGWLTRLAISGPEGAKVDVYNRAFNWSSYHADAKLSVANIRHISADPNGKLRVQCDITLPLVLGDLVQLANTSVTGYNTTLRVIGRNLLTPDTVELDASYTTAPADLSSATLTLAIPSAEYNLYRAMDQLTLAAPTATTVLFNDASGVDLLNGDGWCKSDRPNHPIYFKFDTIGTYRLAGNIVRPTYV